MSSTQTTWVRSHGCDSLRLYELFVGPPEMDAEWSDRGIDGVHRFLKRSWNWILDHNGSWSETPSRRMLTQRHILVKKVTERLEAFRLNTVVSAMMEFLNEVLAIGDAPDQETVEVFLILMSPFAPHFAEELWVTTGHEPSIFKQTWPDWNESYTKFETVTVAVQINGKMRDKVTVDADSDESVVLGAAMESTLVSRRPGGQRDPQEDLRQKQNPEPSRRLVFQIFAV